MQAWRGYFTLFYLHDFSVIAVEGKCYTMGSNQFGQLGYDKEQSDRRPGHVKVLSSSKISAVACGDTFTVAISDGKSFSIKTAF